MSEMLCILNFHGIGRPLRDLWAGEERVWITEEFFQRVLDEIKAQENVLVTFDDGNISDVEIALPELQARGMKAQFFVVSEFVGRRGFLSANDVRTLHSVGMVIGNHGKKHRSWRGMADTELHEEMGEAKVHLEQIISERIQYAACPYGEYDRRVLNHLRRWDYQHVYTSDGGHARRSAWLQPRNSLRRNSTIEGVRKQLAGPGFAENLVQLCKRVLKKCR